jgi:hypothetical protein
MSEALGHVNGRWWVTGMAADLDEAWDLAKDTALAAWGGSWHGAGSYVEDFAVNSQARLEGVVTRELGITNDGPHALALANPRDWATRKARVVLTDPGLVLPVMGDEPAELMVDADIDAAIDAALGEAGKARDDAEQLVRATMLSRRVRGKTVLERVEGANQKRFVLMDGARVLGVYANLTDAKRAAKAGDAGVRVCEIYALSGRADDAPLMRATWQTLSQRATISVVLGRPKSPDKNRTAGWLFVGED